MRKEPDAGDKFINQYQIIEKLGKGSFGKVKLIKHTETGETFAMKIFNKNVLKKKRMGTRNMIQDVEHEIRIMKMMDHPNCVKLYEVRTLIQRAPRLPPTTRCIGRPATRQR